MTTYIELQLSLKKIIIKMRTIDHSQSFDLRTV